MHIHGHNFYLLAMGSGKFDMCASGTLTTRMLPRP